MTSNRAIVGWAVATILVAAAGLGRYPSSFWAEAAFHAAFVGLILLVIPRPRSHVYSSLTAMLVLGFWTKFLIRHVVDYEFLEPIGAFDGSEQAWNLALLTVTSGVLGVVCCRLIQLGWTRMFGRNIQDDAEPEPDSRWFERWGPWLWGSTIIATIGLYAWNAHAAVYITGVTPRVVLPFSLNAAIAWWYLLGLPLWLATLLGWELARRRTRTLTAGMLLIPIVEAVANAASLLSRASFILRVTPYLLATTRLQTRRPLKIGAGQTTIVVLTAAGFAASLVVVTLLRVQAYSAAAPPPAFVETPTAPSDPAAPVGLAEPNRQGRTIQTSPETLMPPTKSRLRFAVEEVGQLFLDRWTGLEGVLAVTSSTDHGVDLLTRAVREDPAVGEEALYQRIALAEYPPRDEFTFLTLAGAMAILALSGSNMVVWFGMAVVTAVCMACESVCRRFTANELVCAVLGVGAAFAVAQATFPRLFLVFLIELWVTVLILSLLHRALLSPGPRRSSLRSPVVADS